MAYSTQTQLENNVEVLERTYPTAGDRTAIADERIALADSIVKTDCGRYIDFDLVPAVGASPATPEFINLLSQYKSAEMTLVRLSSAIRKNKEMHDITYWQDLYNALKEKIADGLIDLELSDGTTIGRGGQTVSKRGKANTDITPYFGHRKYGRWANNTDLEEIRQTDDGGF
jgi:hypothetical protein